MFVKKILIDLDGVLNEYGKGNFDENFILDIKDGAYEFCILSERLRKVPPEV